MPVNDSVKKGLELIEKDNSKVLGLKVGENVVTTPGQYIPKAEAQSPPELTFNVPSQSGTYLVIGLDIDAPFPAFGVLGPILHWIQPGIKPSTTSPVTLSSTSPFVANYIGPAPPPIGGAHRYIFFLYEQPQDFEKMVKKYTPPGGAKLGNGKRMRYDLDAFAKEAGLGDVLAVNYFRSN